MKKRFELESGESWEDSARSQSLGCPVKKRCGQRAEKNGRGEIAEQSGCVFQAANVRFGPDAQSTYMD